MAHHMAQIEKTFNVQPWETGVDTPTSMRDIAMVTTLHGVHYTVFVFNDYAQQLALLKRVATQIPTLHVVNDTFSRREETMAAIIAVATLRAELT
jgi:hypothetical protein